MRDTGSGAAAGATEHASHHTSGETASVRVELVPFELTRFSVRRASDEQAEWLARTLTTENARVDGPSLEYTGETIRTLRRSS